MEVNHKVVDYIINKKNIKNFETMENRRRIRESQVNKIMSAIRRGDYVDLTFRINKYENKYRLIDGNHRFEAIRRILEKSKEDMDFRVHFYMYSVNLKDEPLLYNSFIGSTPNKADQIKIFQDEITFFKVLRENEFPCNVSIYKSNGSLQMTVILDTLASTIKSEEKTFNPIILGRLEAVEFAKGLLFDDFVLLKTFLIDFIEVFGKISSDNLFSKLCFLSPLFNIYVKNIDMGNDEIKKRFKMIIGEPKIIQFTTAGGRAIQSEIRKSMVELMNRGRSKNLII